MIWPDLDKYGPETLNKVDDLAAEGEDGSMSYTTRMVQTVPEIVDNLQSMTAINPSLKSRNPPRSGRRSAQ